MKTNYIIVVLVFFALTIKAQINSTLSNEEKIFGLSKLWQEANYNFVYLEKIDRQKWDATYREMIKTVQQTKNDYEYYRELQRFYAHLKDGHTFIFLPKSMDSLVYTDMFGEYRIFLKNIENKAIVTHVNESKKTEIPPGSEIIEVNGLPTQDYIQQFVAPYISSSSDFVLRDESVTNLLRGLKGEQFSIKILAPGGAEKKFSLKHAFTGEKEIYPPMEEKKLLEFKWIDHQIAYVALNSFKNRTIDTLFGDILPELQRAKGLVVDLRTNAGGNTNTGTDILQYLTNDTILYGGKSITRCHMPSYKAWGRFANPNDTSYWARKSYLMSQDKYYYAFDYYPTTYKADKAKINIPTALLIGHNTFSAAEDFLIYADNQKHMLKIGENSYGSTGEALMFDLPGGGFGFVCTVKYTFPDGREFVGIGVKPDIEVKPSIIDFLNGTDPVLDKAKQYLKTKCKGPEFKD